MSDEFEMTPIRKNTKKVLGRGLGSLLGEAATEKVPPPKMDNSVVARNQINSAVVAAPEAQVRPVHAPAEAGQKVWQIPIEKLFANKEQPRKKFDNSKLQELAVSIKEKGILLPILARKKDNNTFEIIAGERRWRAAQMAGQKEVPVILRDSANKEALEEAIVENVQRHDLNPMEEAEAYKFLAEKYLLTQQQIAEKVGKDRVTIANLMRLTGLTHEVREMVKGEEISLGQAKVLLSVQDPKQQVQLARKTAKNKLSVRALEKLVAQSSDDVLSIENESSKQVFIKDTQAVVSELQRLFGTRVSVEGSGQRGKIQIHFHSYPEFNNIIDKMRKIKT